MKAPCKDCPDRFYDPETSKTCHQSCDKYAAFRQSREEIRRQKAQESIMTDYSVRTIQRIRKTSRRKGLYRNFARDEQ